MGVEMVQLQKLLGRVLFVFFLAVPCGLQDLSSLIRD